MRTPTLGSWFVVFRAALVVRTAPLVKAAAFLRATSLFWAAALSVAPLAAPAAFAGGEVPSPKPPGATDVAPAVPKPQRVSAAPKAPNAVDTPDPAASRRATADSCAALLAKGGPTGIAIEKVLEDGSVGALPARIESRATLAHALAEALSGVTIEAGAAHSLADALAIAANCDGLASTEIAEARSALLAALADLKVAKARASEVESGFDRVVCESRCPIKRRVASDLRSIEWPGDVTSAHAKWLEDDLSSLATGDAKPAPQSVRALALDLAIALDERWLTPKAQARLVYGLDSVLSVAAATDDAFDAVARDVKDLLDAGRVDRFEVELILSDLKGIHGETTGSQPATKGATGG